MNNDQKIDCILEKMSSMDGKFNIMEEKINAMDEKMANMDVKIGAMDEKIGVMDKKMGAMNEKIDVMDKKMGTMDERINDLQSDVKSIKLQIENEICPSIMRVAEGHMDLDRKLKEVATSRTEYEMLTLRVNHLEAAVEKIEKKIS